MNKKYLIILIVLMIFSVGCENKKSSALKNGQTALESHEYVKAQKYLSEALEQDSKNETARAMYMQAIKMPEAEYYKEKGLYNKGIESLESIVNLNNGSQKIKVESASLKNELEKSQSEFEEASNIRKENAKEAAKKGVKNQKKNFTFGNKINKKMKNLIKIKMKTNKKSLMIQI